MSHYLEQTFSELQSLWTNPASYLVEKEDNSNEDFRTNLIKLFSNMKTLDDTTVQKIQNLLTSIMKETGMNIDYSDLKDYLNQICNNPNPLCSCFVDNTSTCESYGDDSVIPVSVLFGSMQCKSCCHFKEDHNACSKFNLTEYKRFSSDPCITCGLGMYDHKSCMNYVGSDDTHCDSCGRDLFEHQQTAKKHGQSHCGNFVKSDGFTDCANCIHSEADHYMNPKLFTMNKDAYSKFTDLAFQFQAEFIGLSQTDMIAHKDILMKVMNMNYTKSHPMHKKFATVSSY